MQSNDKSNQEHSQFLGWIELKEHLHKNKPRPYFKEREIWWASIGFNVGDEQHGNNDNFERPVLIVKKFNNNLFWDVPLTGKPKSGKYYYKIHSGNREASVILSQLRVLDAKRLVRKLNVINEDEFIKVLSCIYK